MSAAPGPGTQVSVIVPAFDAAGTILETLASACDQTHAHLEILVVDDGSQTSRLPWSATWPPPIRGSGC